MRILITGAGGFVGQILTKALLNDEQGRYHVVLTDVFDVPIPDGVKWPKNATIVRADLLEEPARVVDAKLEAAFIFHGIMSSASEENFELGMTTRACILFFLKKKKTKQLMGVATGMKVNFDSTRALLNCLRENCPGIRVIYTSTNAVYGGAVPQPVAEKMRPTPESSYGCEKMMCECLINEYTRRGWLDGFIFRLPSISVRPGKPSGAASSFFSGIVREPLQGLPCVIPLQDRSYGHWLSSPRTLVKNLVHGLDLPSDSLPAYDRVINMPGIAVTVQGMMDSLARVGGQDKLQYVSEQEDPKLAPILYSWPAKFDNSKSASLGFHFDGSFDDIVADFRDTLV